MTLPVYQMNPLLRSRHTIPVVYWLLVIAVIFLYFLQWKTYVMYGDDLYVVRQYMQLHSFSEKMNLPTAFGKFRPVHGISLQLAIDNFHSNVDGYYIFNVAVQALNTIIFASILNVFFRSVFCSVVMSLIIGLSRFSLFNITQITNGGVMEGLAITFLLATLLQLLKIQEDDTTASKRKALVWALVFANLAMYTHERYIVIMPFIFFFVILMPTLKNLSKRDKLIFAGAAIASVLLNIIIKKYFLAMPFFMGTGGESIEFSLSRAANFFKEAFLSLFLVNSGPEYLTGIQFSSISKFYKALSLLAGLVTLVAVVRFIINEAKLSSFRRRQLSTGFTLSLLLGGLFFLFLLPAVITIRIEQRWLQASFCLLILLLGIAFSKIRFGSNLIRGFSISLFTLVFLAADRNYLSNGAARFYFKDSENTARLCKNALDDGTISQFSKKVYIVLNDNTPNVEAGLRWSLGEGYFFELYGGRNKQVVFVDSVYDRVRKGGDETFKDFNAKTDQVIWAGSKLFDITSQFVEDTMRNFDAARLENPTAVVAPTHEGVLIEANNADKYNPQGFYPAEGNMRWSNGAASLELEKGYQIGDSVTLKVTSYALAKTKKIVPVISVIDGSGKEYKAALKTKGDGVFIYDLNVDKNATINKVMIASDTINARPDNRRLSFPFVSLEIKKKP